MSYEWSFEPRGERPSRQRVEAWLVDRPWWQLGADRATYYAPATGVYFGIDWLPDTAPAPLRFSVDLVLPEVFAIEALREIEALVEAFALDLAGPTGAPPHGGGRFDPDRALLDWRERNTRACAEELRTRRTSELDAPPATLPRATHLAIWRWNRCLEAYGERLATVEMIPCVPSPVRLVVPHGDRTTVLTAVYWEAGAPLVLPEVDLVLAAEAPDLAPVVIPQVALRPWLDAFERREAGTRFGRSGVIHDCGLPHWIVDDVLPRSRVPSGEGLGDALRSLGSRRRLVPVGPHEVLDRETVRSVERRDRPGPIALAG